MDTKVGVYVAKHGIVWLICLISSVTSVFLTVLRPQGLSRRARHPRRAPWPLGIRRMPNPTETGGRVTSLRVAHRLGLAHLNPAKSLPKALASVHG